MGDLLQARAALAGGWWQQAWPHSKGTHPSHFRHLGVPAGCAPCDLLLWLLAPRKCTCSGCCCPGWGPAAAQVAGMLNRATSRSVVLIDEVRPPPPQPAAAVWSALLAAPARLLLLPSHAPTHLPLATAGTLCPMPAVWQGHADARWRGPAICQPGALGGHGAPAAPPAGQHPLPRAAAPRGAGAQPPDRILHHAGAGRGAGRTRAPWVGHGVWQRAPLCCRPTTLSLLVWTGV